MPKTSPTWPQSSWSPATTLPSATYKITTLLNQVSSRNLKLSFKAKRISKVATNHIRGKSLPELKTFKITFATQTTPTLLIGPAFALHSTSRSTVIRATRLIWCLMTKWIKTWPAPVFLDRDSLLGTQLTRSLTSPLLKSTSRKDTVSCKTWLRTLS